MNMKNINKIYILLILLLFSSVSSYATYPDNIDDWAAWCDENNIDYSENEVNDEDIDAYWDNIADNSDWEGTSGGYDSNGNLEGDIDEWVVTPNTNNNTGSDNNQTETDDPDPDPDYDYDYDYPYSVPKDCAGVVGGTAYYDPDCKKCVGGTTGKNCDDCSGVENAYMIVIDTNNNSRYVTGNTHLKMVSNGAGRYASFSVQNVSGVSSVIWSEGSGSGLTRLANFPTSGSVDVTLNNCKTVSGNVDIVPGYENDLSTEITLMESKLSAIKNALTNTPFFPVSKSEFKLEGTGIIKNVDKYANGTSIGIYLDLDLEGTISYTFLPINSPKIPIGATGIKIWITGRFGEISGSASIHGTYDPSIANPNSISGSISASAGNAGFGVSASWGPEFCNVYGRGEASINKVTITGDIVFVNNQLIMKPKLEVDVIKGSLSVGVSIAGVTCEDEVLEYSESIPTEYLPHLNDITLYNNN